MEDLEKRLAQNGLSVIEEKPLVAQENDMSSTLDLSITKATLQQEGTISKLIGAKEEQLIAEAEARRIQAETERINKEVEKAEQEKRKQLAELDKAVAEKKKEVEQLKAEGDKAQAFFESNKEILEYVGCKSKKTLRVMFLLMIPATFVFMLVRFLALPFTISGKLLEGIIDTVTGICNKITNNALKIIIAVVVIGVIVACGFFAYFYGAKLISNVK